MGVIRVGGEAQSVTGERQDCLKYVQYSRHHTVAFEEAFL